MALARLAAALVLCAAPARAGEGGFQASGGGPAARAPPSGIRFIEDDWTAAVARARLEDKPLFVDAWATWCHTCLSMQRFVFPDAGLAPIKDAVVWLSIETERERNREFVERFPSEGLPTFLLLDASATSTVRMLGRWLGAATVKELRSFVYEGARALREGDPPAGSATAPHLLGALLARSGDGEQLRGSWAAAARSYRGALGLLRIDDRLRPEVVLKLASALGRLASATGTAESAVAECVVLGASELRRAPPTAVGADLAAALAGCAEKASAKNAGAQKLLRDVRSFLSHLAGRSDAQLSADDRSDLLATLAGLQQSAGQKREARATTRRRLSLLEAAARAAPDAATASTFDAHRTECYLALGLLEPAAALLRGRERELPADYNPPARLARVLLESKDLEGAGAAVGRALALMPQGPRRVRVLELQAEILAAAGKPAAEPLREALTLLRSLPGPRREGQEARLQTRLGALLQPSR